jgi:hypothetical protein
LQLQLALPFACRLDLSALCGEPDFLLLCFTLCGLPASLFFFLLDFPLIDLFFQCTETSLCCFTLPGQLVFLLAFFVFHALRLRFLSLLLLAECLLCHLVFGPLCLRLCLFDIMLGNFGLVLP